MSQKNAPQDHDSFMVPSVLSAQIRRGVEDFLRTTFPVSTPAFHGIIDRLIEKGDELFKGPYISIKLPFRYGSETSTRFFPDIPLDFTPYVHQEKAFNRLHHQNARSTIVATGTGSGKTECFLYPVLDYCCRHRGEKGIKAIIIYPMNALATDQARRLAKVIYRTPGLKNTITVGLFIGQKEERASMVMGPDQVITNKDTLRLRPPDILLTNYKMLDYLLIRPKDYPLWKGNGPDTLQYLIVDELHTFDGAQGTDLACLIRRLKERLKTPPQYLCCIGTSATLGEKEDVEELRRYTSEVFGESFHSEAIITESLLTPEEFYEGSIIAGSAVVPPQQADQLAPDAYSDYASYIKKQHELWFGERIGDDEFERDTWKVALAEKIKQHGFFRHLLTVLNTRTTSRKIKKSLCFSIQEIIEVLDRIVPEFTYTSFAQGAGQYKQNVINSMVALISSARVKKGERLVPFLQVRFQLWQRELRRMVADIAEEPSLKFSDDLKEEHLRTHLPVIYCRECGAMGWGATKREQDTVINSDLQHFYLCFFKKNPTLTFIFPRERYVPIKSQYTLCRTCICGHCLTLNDDDRIPSCPSCGERDRLIPIHLYNTRIKRKDTVRSTRDCPFCQGFNSLTILGSRAASLMSVVISQLYSSPFNDDKKLLAFSDSVQDASHRAGFFSARTFRFNMRSALQHFVDRQKEEMPLTRIPKGFIDYWSSKMPTNEFITTFLPLDMTWLHDYEYLIKHEELPEGSDLLANVHKRVDWEIISEYGFNCRIGRILEKTGSSIAHFNQQQLHEAVGQLIEPLQNEIGGLRNVDKATLYPFLYGLLTQMKAKGAIFHPSLKTYLENWGGYYILNKIPSLPNFGKQSRTPIFLTTKRGTRFDPLLSGSSGANKTWHEEWVEKNFWKFDPHIAAYADQIYNLVLSILGDCHLLEKIMVKGWPIWGLNNSALLVSKNVLQYRCRACGHLISVEQTDGEYWQKNHCLRFRCGGQYVRQDYKEDYYGKLYSTDDVKRIFAEEHTALLKREARENLEGQFIHGKNPWDPNLLSCTPTLELGIDIGDLSSMILCSVPPGQAQYLQRIGRAGRKNGNAFTVTVANGRPHDLYFYHQPEEMIAGKVETPGCFLNAPAVLTRQFTAFCFDRWVETGIDSIALPHRLGRVLKNLEAKEKKKLFPYNFITFIDQNRTAFFKSFTHLFQDVLTEESIVHLRSFIEGRNDGQANISLRLIHGLSAVYQERKSLRKKVQRLTALIKQQEKNPAKDKNYESELDDLKREKSILNSIIWTISQKDTFNFFTDEGLLPNYAFPEAGVILRSVIYRNKKKADHQGKYETKLFEYERPAASAILELAPSSRFYAGGRKVTIDQINMNLSEIEEWRFCNNCAYIELVVAHEEKSCCPKYGSPLWADEGQKRQMLRMRQVIATTNDQESRNWDDSDEREVEFYNKNMLVHIDEQYIEDAYKIDKENFTFGFDFARKATFRIVNFGKKDTLGETINIAGQKIPKNGFAICRECGKVQETKNEPIHAITCRYRNSKSEKNIMDFVYLYREFSSEAIRILLPVSTFADSTDKLHSLIAALVLGLKKKFKGNINHLQVAIDEEPLADSTYRKKYLILYDIVQGGTGYLKQLMKEDVPLIEVFEKALEALKSCPCRNDPEKDGCYRCLYVYRNSSEMANISQEIAIRMLSDIVGCKNDLVQTDSIKNISLNPLFESELEARFIEALRRSKFHDNPLSFKQDVVNGKPGWFIKINGSSYYIEPQVDLGPGEGVAIPCRADFVFYPGREKANCLPVAVFTDGFLYHADTSANTSRVGKDMAQRMAVVRSGKYMVWSLSWEDVQTKFSNNQKPYFENFMNANPKLLFKFLKVYDRGFHLNDLSQVHTLNSFDMFIYYLSRPDINMWKMYALIHSMLPINPKCPCSHNTIKDLCEKLQDNTPWKETMAEMPYEEHGEYLSGVYEKFYDNKHPMLTLISYAEKASFKNFKGSEIKVLCRFFDDKEIAANPDFKVAWNGFIRMFNMYQFIPNAHFITSQGVIDGVYARLAVDDEPTTIEGIAASESLAELMEVIDRSLHPLISSLALQNLPLPDAGYELCSERGEIVAVAELAWPQYRIAFLREEEMAYSKVFASFDWRTAPLKEAMTKPEEAVVFIRRLIEKQGVRENADG